ncbi:MAG TPA: IgGFc-binding protein, partial [Candidatus Kapabacteria bacterium]|nr:IgGFc-binding protein [Candidatus Kapabacteria bacterium]
MALRKIVFFVALSLLVKIAGSEEAAAQKGKAEAQLGSTVLEGAKVRPEKARPEKARPEPKLELGTRPLQIAKSHPRPPSLASIAAPAGSSAFAPPKYKTSGREFWAVFPSIIGNEDDDANPPKRTLYIASRGRTKVKVKFERRPWEVNVVTVPGQVSVVELPSWGVLRQTQFESVFDLGIKIEAEDDITVYGFSHEGLSSDGWLILPKEALGQHYLVASQRNSMNYPQSWQDAFKPRSTMVIMAVEDGTRIDFRLTATSQSGNLMKDTLYTILLNKGELFPIMARDTGVQQRITYPLHNLDCDPILDGAGNPIYGQQDMYTSSVLGADPDLTGSEVISDKPIVVVSGHERASTPDSNEFNPERVLRDCMLGISRDHLTEQMPPVELWGNEFFVMASRQDRGRTREASDMVRIISATDNNVIEVNGVAIATLNARQYYQFSSGALSHVKTSQPALVVKYMKSMTARANHHMGDPDMTIVPPVSNMSTAYTLPVVDNRLVFEEMYVNILVHDQGISSLRVNGKPPQTRPIKIANTEWSYYNEWGSPGEWRIECDLPCFAETYGYGYADGYTFAGGGDFKYQDSLFGDVLDYRTILIGRSKPLSGKISTGA